MLAPRPRRGRRRLAVRQGPLQLPGRALRRAHHRRRWCARARSCCPRQLGEGARRRRLARSKKAGDRASRAGRRHDDQRGGVPAAAAAARRPRLEPPERPHRRRAAARRAARAGRPEAAGDACRTSSSRTPCCWSTATRSTRRRCWDLRIRKGVRRHGTKLVVASARPTALDPIAAATLRFAPGGGEGFLVALDAALAGDAGNLGGAASRRGHQRHGDPRVRRRAARRRRGGRDRLRRARAARAARAARC